MSTIGSNLVERFLTQAIPNTPGMVQRLSAFRNPAPGNILPILPKEASVTVGRSAFAWNRDGFLEFQERLLEELTVAAVWLKGVSWCEGIFDRWIAPRLGVANTAVEWSWQFAKKSNSVDLSPLQRHTRSMEEAQSLLRTKALRFGFSTFVPLLLVAVAIPWLNQKKTDWILQHFYKSSPPATPTNTPPQKPASHSNTNPASSPQWLPPSLRQVSLAVPNSPTFYRMPPLNGFATNPASLSIQPIPNPFPNPIPLSRLQPLPPAIPAPPWRVSPSTQTVYPQAMGAWTNTLPPLTPAPASSAWVSAAPSTDSTRYTTPPLTPTPMAQARFTRSPLASLVGMAPAVGHLVDNTNYGQVLVIDTGIVTGRSGIALFRSPIESLELAFRDVGSLYFYLLCEPHLMKHVFEPLCNKLLNVSVTLEGRVADRLHERTRQRLEQYLATRPPGSGVTVEALKNVLLGTNTQHTSHLIAAMAEPLTSVSNRDAFFTQLEIEGRLHGLDSKSSWLPWVQKQLSEANISTQSIQKLLDTLEQPAEGLPLGDNTAKDSLKRSIQYAFRHTVGVSPQSLSSTLESLQTVPPKSELFNALLQKRIEETALRDGLNIAHGMLEHGQYIAGKTPVGASSVLKLVESASMAGQSLEEALRERFLNLKEALSPLAKAEPKLSLPPLDDLIRQQGPIHAEDTAWIEPLSKDLRRLLDEKTGLGGWPSKKRVEKVLQEHLEPLTTLMNELGLDAAAKQQGNSSRFTERVAKRLREQLQEYSERSPDEKIRSALNEYAQQIEPLLSEGRLFSLQVNAQTPEAKSPLARKIAYLAQGGLSHDEAMIRQGMQQVGTLPSSSQGYLSLEKLSAMEEQMTHYSQQFFHWLEKKGLGQAEWSSVEDFSKNVFSHYLKLSQNTQLVVWGVSSLAAMLGLGIVIPKLQYWITQCITGSNQHPGLAVAEARQGVQRANGLTTRGPVTRGPIATAQTGS
ncbi:MAG: hypothetical protein SFZ03_09130 [Candidatus Melainabacteria bacterium]|nr:hypothetical protein [Candidatus Melainabacteria bacterium]